jgi:predicted lipase
VLSHEPAPKRIIIAFRGTYSITNTIIDLSTTQQTYVPYPAPPEDKGGRCENCTVHTGFYESWKDAQSVIGDVLEEVVEKYGPYGYKLEILGHSLGGAVAALAGLDAAARGWKPRITTFGEPRVGNEEFTKFISEHFDRETFRRITHTSDPVPHLPFDKWGFAPHEVSSPILPIFRWLLLTLH